MPLRVLLASAQVRGLSSTGGLGDVVAALARALAARPDVLPRIVLPAPIPGPADHATRTVHERLEIPLGARRIPVRVRAVPLPAAPEVVCYLLEPPEPIPHDSPAEAVLLSRGALELARRGDPADGFRPDLIHAHDWHAGLIAACRDLLPATGAGPDPAVVFTTHNLGRGFQGEFDDRAAVAHLAGLDSRASDPRAAWLEPAGRFNASGAALAFADRVNTVSPSYARELRDPAYSGALAPLIAARTDLVGLLNGIDFDEWDPRHDPALGDVPFAADWPVPRIIAHKHALRQRLRDVHSSGSGSAAYPLANLADSSVLLASIGRIDAQKVPILAAAVPDLIAQEGVQLVLLGDAHPRDEYGQRTAASLHAEAAASAGRFVMMRRFDPDLSHRIYAAADILLVPSVYEPCGLTQLIAMRYGTVPIVRATGGLADTVIDEAISPDANGFTFREPLPDPTVLVDVPAAASQLAQTVRHAIDVLRENPVRWAELVRNGMTRDSAWTAPASRYVAIYRDALATRAS